MKVRIASGRLIFLLVAIFGFSGMVAKGSESYGISASNVVMTSTGNGTSQYTVKGVPLSGTLTISCTNAGPIDSSTKVPKCYTGPPQAIPVVAGQTVTGTLYFVPFGSPLPGLAFLVAGSLFLYFGFRRRSTGWLATMVVAATALGAMGLSSCGGSSSTMTYQFSVSAVNSPTLGEGPSSLATSTLTVTVK